MAGVIAKRVCICAAALLCALSLSVWALASSTSDAGQISAATFCRESLHLHCRAHGSRHHAKAGHRRRRRRHHHGGAVPPASGVSPSFGVTIELGPPGISGPSNNGETIAAVLSITCPYTNLTPTAEDLPLVREATLCLINQERARNGENPLPVNEQLLTAAQTHSERMVSEDYFDHISPSGETPLERLEAVGYIPKDNTGYIIGENIAWGTQLRSTPQAIVEAWLASPEHLANILENSYTETGIGVDPAAPAALAKGRPGATYTQEFGVVEIPKS
jgi:uncharacterized protein YkwD